jgi:4-amino-4-deoxy-L-arabinose transferase-like glycosyltransferase
VEPLTPDRLAKDATHRGFGPSAAVAAIALAVRLAVVAWAAPRIVPIDDAAFYLRIAERLAQGLGYTWVWPDGSVTYSAFYPVGYPAMVAAVFAVTGPRPAAAMVLNAILGALGAFAAHRLALRAAPDRRLALASGLLVALHPALVAYTPVLMTDGVVAALVTCAAAVTAWARDRASARPLAAGAAIGFVVGIATLVRPQSIVLAPIFGLVAASGGATSIRRMAALAGAATLAAILVCAPWTARNCVRMKRCALVSYNGGWNLLVSTSGVEPFRVPDACRDVFDEAEKDACFSRAGGRILREHPAAWLALAPGKLAGTFDYSGAAPWYLHASNPAAFPYAAKVALGAAETLLERVALLGALAWAARRMPSPEPRGLRSARIGVALLGAVFAVTLHAWIGYAAFAMAAILRGRSLWKGPVLGGTAVVVLASTMAIHAAFFGLGRYAIVVFPLITALAPMALARSARG